MVYGGLEIIDEIWVLEWSSVYVYYCMNWIVFLFVVVDLDDYCCCFWGFDFEDGAVYVISHVCCYVFLMSCYVVLDLIAVWGCFVYEVVVRERNDCWRVFVVL